MKQKDKTAKLEKAVSIKELDLDEKTKKRILRGRKINRILFWALQFVTLGTIIASVIIYFIGGREGGETTATQVFMGLLSIIIFFVPYFIEKKFKVYIPNYMSMLLYLLLFSHFVLGEIYRVYDMTVVFDKILHTTSGVTIALLSFSIISILNNLPRTKMKLSPFFVVLFTFCFTMTSEYLWEIFEYLVDSFMGGNMQRWNDSLVGGAAGVTAGDKGEFIHTIARGNGLKDTMTDMIVNVFGALGVCVYGYIGLKLKPDWFNGKVIIPLKDIKASNNENIEETIKEITEEPSEEIIKESAEQIKEEITDENTEETTLKSV